MSSQTSINLLPFIIFSSCDNHCSVPTLIIAIITYILFSALIFFWFLNKTLRSIQSLMIINLLIASLIQISTLQFVSITNGIYQELLIWSFLSQSTLVSITSFLSFVIASHSKLFSLYSALFPISLFFLGNLPPVILALLNKFLLRDTTTMSIIAMCVLCLNVAVSLAFFFKIITIKYKDSFIKGYVRKSMLFLYIETLFCLFSFIVSFRSIGTNEVIVVIYLSFSACKGILFSIAFVFFPPMMRTIKSTFCRSKKPVGDLEEDMMKSLTLTMTRLL